MNNLKIALTLLTVAAFVAGCNQRSTHQATTVPDHLTFTGNLAHDRGLVEKAIDAGEFHADWASLEQIGIPEWYQNAKFGIFIHWGVYSVPAKGNEWYPRRMYQDVFDKRRNLNFYQYHRKTWGPQNEFGYKEFIPMFKAESFDAERWAQLFEDAGAKYVVPVAEHHDGFPMYACSYTKWDASEMGPKRDVIGELSQAVRAHGLHFGVSSHRAFDWAYYPRRKDFDTVDPANFGLYGKPRKFQYGNMEGPWPPQSEEFMDNWLVRTAELAENYDPDLVWFDFGIGPHWVESYQDNYFGEHLKKFAAFYYDRAAKRGKVGAINYKLHAMPEKAGILDLERGKLDQARERLWQTDTSVSYSSWGYTTDQDYKTTNSIVDDLVDIVSKNGCLLLNIGPKSDGTIPDKEQQMLREIGQWLKVNGEAIYGTRHWTVYGEGSSHLSGGHMSERQFKDKSFTAADIRFTRNGGTLYAIALDWSGSGWKVKSLGTDSKTIEGKNVTSVELLGSNEKLTWNQTDDGLRIQAPSQQPCKFAYAFRIRLQ